MIIKAKEVTVNQINVKQKKHKNEIIFWFDLKAKSEALINF